MKLMALSGGRFYAYLMFAVMAITVVTSISVFRDPVVREPDVFQSITRGDLSEIEAYLEDGGDPNLRTTLPKGVEWPLLKIALVDREEEVALALLRAGADLESSEMLFGGFVDVANEGLIEVLQYLLSTDTSGLRSNSTSGISGAAGRGYYDAVELLLDHIDVADNDWRQTLRLGAISSTMLGYDDVAILLVEAGADLDQLLHIAARFGSPGMIRYLLRRGADPVSPQPEDPTLPKDWPRTPIEAAFQRLREQEFANTADLRDGTGLPEEYRDSDAALVLFELIRAGAALDGADDVAVDGIQELNTIRQPAARLVAAARLGFLDVVQSLLAEEPGISNEELRQAVVVALQKDHDDIARLLLASGAPADGGPLHVAAAASSPGMVRYLLQLGADPGETFGGKTPLEYWREIPATAEKARILHELVIGGADACWLMAHWDEFDFFVQDRLQNSAASCWQDGA